MKKALMIVAIVAIIAITGSMVYYFVFFQPGIVRATVREEKIREENLDKCLKEADDWYIEMIIAAKKDNITLGAEGYDILNKMLQEKKDYCYKRYGK
ncbi:MAG: hypothetical protein ACYDIA_14115 [Candidatus Humimicrobiaceae bacterium]